jgi:ubiquinone/menaquinone biosynthesis C-methylase UbiE
VTVRRHVAALLLLLLAFCGSAERKPAAVISVSGADWLERPTREEEDRPDLVLAAMRLKNGDVVADVGAGSGFFSRRLARAVAPDGVVLANDIQPEMLDLLKANAARERVTNIRPILGTATDPSLPKASADWILLVDVYHEFQEPAIMLGKLRDALKPDGRVALVEYRSEGTTASHIREEHRMSREQVLREWTPAGFTLVETIETLPSQHLFIFRKR